MITRIVNEEVEVQISGKNYERDMVVLKTVIEPEDIHFDGHVWVISNPLKYAHISFVAKAMKQLEVPGIPK